MAISTLETLDLFIEDGDLVLKDGEPETLTGLAAVAQDIKHLIIESGLFIGLVGERDPDSRQMVFKKIKILIEDDARIKPGSAQINEVANGQYNINAQALNGALLELTP